MTKPIHPSLTVERVEAAARRRMTSLDDPGFCTACGEDADDVEPDAEGYECEYFGKYAVVGADELLLRLI